MQKNSKYLVNVIIVAYNHEKYIRTTLDSVLGQKTQFPYRVVVADDCSPDHSNEIFREYEAKYGDRLKIIRRPANVGVIKNLFSAMSDYRSCKYFAFCSGDDYWIDENKLQLQYDYLETHDDVSVALSGYRKFFEDTNECKDITSWDSPLTTCSGKKGIKSFINKEFSSFPMGSTMMLRAQEFVRLLDERKILYENKDIPGEGMVIYPILADMGRYSFIPQMTTVYRIHDGSLSHNKNEEKVLVFQIKYAIQIMDVSAFYHIGLFRRLKQIMMFVVSYFNAALNGLNKIYADTSSKFLNGEYCKAIKSTIRTVIFFENHETIRKPILFSLRLWHGRHSK